MHDPVRELTLDELPRPPFTGCMKLSRGRLVLARDVDSTVWNLSAWLCEAVLDVTGEPLGPEASRAPGLTSSKPMVRVQR